MSTFAVFGMTRALAMKIAKDKVPTNGKSESQWLEEVRAHSDEIMGDDKQSKQLSELFDSPQFAKDFIDLARSSAEGVRLDIRYKKDAGLNNKTGKPIKRWTKYAG